MEALLLALRFALVIVFGISGAAKLADLDGSQKALEDFDVPSTLAAPLSVVLPVVELATAAAFLFVGSSWFGSIAAVVMLTAFSVGMAVQIAKGRSPNCHCFGQLSSEPVSKKSLLRNIALLVPAVVLAGAGRNGQGLSIANMNVELVQLFTIAAGVVVLVAGLAFLRKITDQQSQIIRRIELLDLISREGNVVEREDAGSPHEGLPIGSPVPLFELADIEGAVIATTASRDRSRPALFFFVSPTCGPCQALLPQFEDWLDELQERLDLIFVSSGSAKDNSAKFAGGRPKTILLQEDREFAESVGARWTPAAIYVDAQGRVASHVAAGDTAIEDLVNKIREADTSGDEFTYFALGNGHDHGSELTIGTEVPDFTAEDLTGRTINSADLVGKPTLMTFWSPTCPHCENMLDEIRGWDGTKGVDEPNLIVFSDGEPEQHADINLSSPVILDKGYKIAEQLGMSGTPSAILVDEHGKFASELAIGAHNIWALVGRSGLNRSQDD